MCVTSKRDKKPLAESLLSSLLPLEKVTCPLLLSCHSGNSVCPPKQSHRCSVPVLLLPLPLTLLSSESSFLSYRQHLSLIRTSYHKKSSHNPGFGLNCHNSQSICWSADTQCNGVWRGDFGEVKRFRWGHEGGVLIRRLVPLTGKGRDKSPLSPHQVRTQWEGSYLQSRKSTHTKNQPRWHLDLGHPSSRAARMHVFCLSQSVSGILLCQHKPAKITPQCPPASTPAPSSPL